ncbi:glycosyltransferase family 2 protein [Streptomyces europaeiscabiei]|uniref:glycosyltransferase family 2 protein n=1 Tax=Streptomyces europaeiscabiei TaxID=146819 RepID=UPI0029B96851|nr:glycosyltransferase family 2 protein [Streptomyces europaeiscabiei]MDX2525272.1 glycosyltransferase family 2 protein [Streptomyces europaeiscabiei]
MPPRLSVIIPFYNSDPYFAECLESVAAQDFSDMEVILVDDGSTDDSPEIALDFAAQDARFRVLRQSANKGPGSTRNVGLAQSDPRSDYIAFADSDDLLPRDAYSALVACLDGSGSDFATGNVLRFNSSGFFQFEKYAQVFQQSRKRAHIFEMPVLAVDRTVWNKVYRRTFWDRHNLLFPEGMLYEDSPVTIPLHYVAKKVDVVSETVYCWRIREAGELSITQQRTIRAMLDRFSSIDIIRAFLKGRWKKYGTPFLVSYDRNVLAEELPLFFNELIDASKQHRLEFMNRAAILLNNIDPVLFTELPQSLQARYAAIEGGRVHELMELLTENSSHVY